MHGTKKEIFPPLASSGSPEGTTDIGTELPFADQIDASWAKIDMQASVRFSFLEEFTLFEVRFKQLCPDSVWELRYLAPGKKETVAGSLPGLGPA